MNKHLKHILFLAAASLPFVCELPYAWRAMLVSPAERWNWCFALWSIVLFLAGAAWNRWKEAPSDQKSTTSTPLRFALLAPAVLLLSLGYFRHIHMAILLGGIMLPMSLANVFYGWRVLRVLLPACGVLVLFCPSVGIWLSTLLPLNGILLKLLLAGGFTLLFPLLVSNLLTHFPVEKTLFCAIALLLAAGYWLNGQLLTRQPPLRPQFDSLLSSQFRGIQEPEDERDRQFFGNSNIQRYFFQDEKKQPFQVLAISDIDNIHNVHPTTYCLRSSGYQILSETSRFFPPDDHLPQIEVLEILADFHGEKNLFWQWYSTPSFSTCNFLLFRMLYSKKDNWSVFILNTPVRYSLETTRFQLRTFLQDFLK
jgi:hypothetical protein